ncbi:WD domain, G-beta repeat [Popillia japonica]|uniref:WD domain, G-beta repeat n=1 Tax=Popillia japonica TaxID=7064 RepID=A0AAW1K330_POPJA
MYDTKSKTINKLFENVPSAVRYMDFNLGDELLAVACASGNAVLYDVINGHFCGNFVISETVEPTALRFHPNLRNILAAASEEGSVMLWDTTTANKTFFAQTHTSPISGIAFGKQDNDVLVSVGEDNKFCVHDLNARECVFRSSTQHPLSAVDVSLDGTTVAIGSQEGIIYLYDMRNFLQPIMVWKAHNSKINKLLFQYPVKEITGHTLDISASDMATKSLSDAQQIKLKLTDHDDKSTATDSSSKISISTKKSIDKGTESTENEFLKKLKLEIITNIRRDALHMNSHLKMHMHNLEGFIQTEFHKMDTQMDEKWELLNLASMNLAKDNDDRYYFQIDKLMESNEESLRLLQITGREWV